MRFNLWLWTSLFQDNENIQKEGRGRGKVSVRLYRKLPNARDWFLVLFPHIHCGYSLVLWMWCIVEVNRYLLTKWQFHSDWLEQKFCHWNNDWFFFLKRCFVFFSFCVWPHHVACAILVPRPGRKPTPSAAEAPCLNHWTTEEVLNDWWLIYLTRHVVQWRTGG